MKRLVCFAMLACAAMATAMPTKKELAQAQKVVSEITASDMRDMKAKKKGSSCMTVGIRSRHNLI